MQDSVVNVGAFICAFVYTCVKTANTLVNGRVISCFQYMGKCNIL